jgi:hypothetical protein
MPNAGACADLITAVDTPGADVPETITMSVYPNPVGDNGRLKVMSKVDQQIDIRVIDMEGRIQMRSMQTVIRGENLIDLHSSRWARGVYFIEVTNRNKEQYRQKLVKL